MSARALARRDANAQREPSGEKPQPQQPRPERADDLRTLAAEAEAAAAAAVAAAEEEAEAERGRTGRAEAALRDTRANLEVAVDEGRAWKERAEALERALRRLCGYLPLVARDPSPEPWAPWTVSCFPSGCPRPTMLQACQRRLAWAICLLPGNTNGVGLVHDLIEDIGERVTGVVSTLPECAAPLH